MGQIAGFTARVSPANGDHHGKQSVNMGSWPARSLFATAIAGLAAGPLSAGSTSGVMAISITIEESCHLDARPMVFAALSAERDRAEARSSVVLTCTPAASYLVTLDDGRHAAGGSRRMADPSGTRFLAYDVYSDAARTRRWGATPASTVGAVAPANGGDELAVYARLSGSQAQTGTYSDTLTVTVAF